MAITHISLFSGLGGFIAAADRNEIKTVWANENDAKCCIMHRAIYPDIPLETKSICDIEADDLKKLPKKIDILSAGFPCQPFSQAGQDARGFDDERGKVFFDIPRIISLLKAPPKVVLLENVPNLKLHNEGATIKTILNELKFAGYWVNEKNMEVLDSSVYGGSPQKRKRLFIVCLHQSYFKANTFDFSKMKKIKRKPLSKMIKRDKKLDDKYYLEKPDKYYDMIEKEVTKDKEKRVYQIRRYFARECPPDTCPTLTANMGGGGHNVPFVFDEWGLRRLSESECLKLQGFKVPSKIIPVEILDKDLLKMVGNAINVDLVDKIFEQIKIQIFEGKNKK